MTLIEHIILLAEFILGGFLGHLLADVIIKMFERMIDTWNKRKDSE